MLFFNVCLFPFSKFRMTIVKKPYNGFRGFLVISTMSQIFWSTHFWKSNGDPFKFFWNLHGYMHFVSLFFLNERNMTTSLLIIHLKCTVVHYTNLNWSSKNKPFLNYGSLNMLFHFLGFLIYVYFNEAFVKIFMK